MNDFSRENIPQVPAPEKTEPASTPQRGGPLLSRRGTLRLIGAGVGGFIAGAFASRLGGGKVAVPEVEPQPNPDNITFTTEAGCDPEKDMTDPRIYWEIPALLNELSKNTKVQVSCINSGHKQYVNGQESAHWQWRAVDLRQVNETEVSPDNEEAKALVETLLRVEGPLRVQKIGSPWDFGGTELDPDGSRTFVEDRPGHIHIQYSKDPKRTK